MTDFAALLQPDRQQDARTLHVVDAKGLEAWLAGQPARGRAMAQAARFKAKAGEFALLPGDGADDWTAVVGVKDAAALGPWDLAATVARLPAGSYRLAQGKAGAAALGWLLAHYKFDRYRSDKEPVDARVLLSSDPASIEATVRLAQATAMVRDLVNTPAEDLGPADLAAVSEAQAAEFGARISIVQGEALKEGYPAVHAVGRAADKAPRLIDMAWGDPAHPRLTIVGKGVCFDSGGLDIKPASGMATMKKDMGGAAHALALARLVMQAKLPVRLRLLIPAVENAIAGNAFRPGDVLRTRKGVSVEIGNTDAEGRLILCDALAAAQEDGPDLILDFATLTGAARVALGPELPALFASDDAVADALLAAGREAGDPMWRLPLWEPYRDMLKSEVADVNNAGDGGFAGAITAALFLAKFVDARTPWAHIDLFAWQPSAKPGRPKGGEAMTLRAVWRFLEARYRA
jgi:leucyl aminopeptidase